MEDGAPTEGGGAKVKLKPWSRRRGRNLGLEGPGGRTPSLIDQVHRLMHLWHAGDQVEVDDYLEPAACCATRCSTGFCSAHRAGRRRL